MRHLNVLAHLVGYHFDPNFGALRLIHQRWKERCGQWKREYMLPSVKELSHLKILSLLLFEMASADWINDLTEFDAESDGDLRDYQFAGTDEELERVREAIRGGRGTYLALEFVVAVINWFEVAREDRLQKFEFRLTRDLRHDIISYLLSDRREVMATYLIFKALYARDPTPIASGN